MIAVIEYGTCNVGSMMNMLRRIGAPALNVRSPAQLEACDKIILPGIGAYDRGMTALQAGDWCGAVRHSVKDRKVPILGVCLGMQLLGTSSAEGSLRGLDLIPAHCERIAGDRELRVPHMGWSTVSHKRANPLFQQMGPDARFYFSHSYHLVPLDRDVITSEVTYGDALVAAVKSEHIFGTQFHPEKSHRYGLALLQNFAML